MSNKPPQKPKVNAPHHDHDEIDEDQVRIYQQIQEQQKRAREKEASRQAHMQRLEAAEKKTKGGPDVTKLEFDDHDNIINNDNIDDEIDQQQVEIMKQIQKQNAMKKKPQFGLGD